MAHDPAPTTPMPDTSTVPARGVVAWLQRRLTVRRATRRENATRALWMAMAAFRQDLSDPHRTTMFTVEDAQRALEQVRRAVAQGADLTAPQEMRRMQAADPKRESLRSMSAMQPMEWALRNGAWTLAEALLDAGVNPLDLGTQALRWNVWTVERPDMLDARVTHQPLWVQAILAAGGIAFADLKTATHGNPVDLLERMVPATTATWDHEGFPLPCQIVLQSNNHRIWSAAWWQRLHAPGTDPLGRNALHWLALRPRSVEHHEDSFAHLITAGVDPYAVDAIGETPLTLLVGETLKHGYADGLLLVLDSLHQAHPDLAWEVPNAWGESPLGLLLEHPWALAGGTAHERPVVVERLQALAVVREQQALRAAIAGIGKDPEAPGAPTGPQEVAAPGASRPRRTRL